MIIEDDAFRRNNHYVSQAYLKRWADTNGRLWAYRVLVSHPKVPLWKHASAKGLAYHTHLYTLVVATGHTDEIERWLNSDFESPAENAIQKVVADDRLTSKDWSHLIKFLAAQDVRTPARLMENFKRWETLPDLVKDVLEKSVQKFETANREGKPLDHSSPVGTEYFPSRVTIESVPGEEGGILRFESVIGRSLWLFHLRRALTKTVNALLAHKWTILCSPEGIEWLTSDDPVVKLNYNGLTNKYDFGGGWGSAGTEIFLPLSPRHLLYTRIGDRPPRRGEVVSMKFAGLCQRFTIEHAHRFVFAATPNASVSELRPRTVDSKTFFTEVEQWRRWHEEQSDAERDLTR